MSRKTSLTPEVKEKILDYIASGAYLETACRAVGIHKDTLYEWKNRGARGEEPFASFLDDFEEANAKAEMAWQLKLRQLAFDGSKETRGDGILCMTYMERRWKDHWSRREQAQVEMSGKDGAPLTVTIDQIQKSLAVGQYNEDDSTESHLNGTENGKGTE